MLPATFPCGAGAYNILSRQTNDVGTYQNITGVPPALGAQVLTLGTNSSPTFVTNTYTGTGWTLGTPNLSVGQAAMFFVSTNTAPSYTINIVAGDNFIANQLDHGSNRVAEIMPSVPKGCALSKYDNASGTWLTASFFDVWTELTGPVTLNPGEGAVLHSPTNFTLTFTGTPHVPVLPVSIPSGACYLLSRQTNDIGTFENIVGSSPTNGTTVYQWTGSNYSTATFSAGTWSPAAPTTAIGEPVWIGLAGGGPPPPPPQSYTINIVTGDNLIANQLDHGSNRVAEVIPTLPNGCVLSKYDNASGTWQMASFFDVWTEVTGPVTLNPGEGAILHSPTNFTLTFTGTPDVPVLPVSIPSGATYLLSRQTNDIGTFENIVGSSPTNGTMVYQWTGSNYSTATFSVGAWSPAAPMPAVGEPVWISFSGGRPPPLAPQSYTVSLPTDGGFYLIANQLDHGSNRLDEVLSNVPDGTLLSKWRCAVQDWVENYTFSTRLGWSPAGGTLAPGEGAMIGGIFDSGTHLTITFTGTPHVPVLPALLPCGYGNATILSRQTNDVGTFETITGLTPAEGAQMALWDPLSQSFTGYAFSSGAWSPSVPSVGVGQAALITVTPSSLLSYTINIVAGDNFIANQLDHGSNRVAEVMPSVPKGCVLSKYDNASGTWMTASFFDVWTELTGPVTLNPGEGAVLHSPTNFTLTFTGTPHVPVLPVSIPIGATYLLSRQTNDIGTFENIVGSSPTNGTTVYQWTGSDYSTATFAAGAWSPAAPMNAVGESVWISPSGGSPPALPGSAPCTISLNCPGNIVLQSCTNAIVNYTVTATNSCGGAVVVTCMPPSGSLFGPGTTAVWCQATNSSDSATSCVFTVTLECPDSGCCSNSTWTTIPLSNAPPARQVHAMAYDSARGVSVLFGGYDANGQPLGDTWLRDGSQWQQAFPASSPSPRYGHEMAYDEAREVVVLYGGSSGSGGTILGDTWEWDGLTWTLRSAAGSPGPRLYHAMAYDFAQNRVMLYGGAGASGVVNGDSWEWTGATWILVAANGAGPGARFWTAMAADPTRQRVVLFGGATNGPGNFDDTWEWNGANWSHLIAAGPPARQGHGLAFSAPCASVLLYGGSNPQLGTLGDTWSWDGSSWASHAVGGPSPRQYLKLATDSQNAAVTLFGGANGTSASDATWKWGCNCPDSGLSLDASGNPILPPGIDTNLITYVEVNRPLGTLDQLYPEWDTSVDPAGTRTCSATSRWAAPCRPTP